MEGTLGPTIATIAAKVGAGAFQMSTLLTLVAVVFASRLWVVLGAAALVAAIGPVIAAIPPLQFRLDADAFVLGFFAQGLVGCIAFAIARRVRGK